VNLICLVLQFYLYALFARIVLSWFPISPGSALAPVFSFLYTITEPVLGPVRRLLPPARMGSMALDLSPIVVLILFQLILARAC
jgi:YggT family protein